MQSPTLIPPILVEPQSMPRYKSAPSTPIRLRARRRSQFHSVLPAFLHEDTFRRMRERQIAILSDADLCRATFASGVTVSSSIKQMEEYVFFFPSSFFRQNRDSVGGARARLVSGNYFISSDRNSASLPGAGPARERIFSPLKRRDAARYELAEMFIDLPPPSLPHRHVPNVEPPLSSARIFGARRFYLRPRRSSAASRRSR